MSELDVTPVGVASNIAFLLRKLQDLVDGLDELDREAVQAKEAYTLAQAKAYVSTEALRDSRGRPLTVTDREARVTLAVESERWRFVTAEQKVRQRREQIWTLKTRVDGGRTVAAVVRSEAELARQQ